MAKVTLTDLTSLANDTSATNSINENFQTLEDYINDNVLSRDTGAETNTMQNDIDMNGFTLLNYSVVGTSSAVPASASATGTAGNWAYDTSYLYICVATDTWKRVALSTW